MSLTDALRQAGGAINSESSSSYSPRTLPPHKDLPPIPARTGSAKAVQQSTSSGGGGGGGVPFEEADYAQREYWPPVSIRSSDGIFAFAVKPIKSIKLADGVATFKQPV